MKKVGNTPVIEGLLEYEKAKGATAAVKDARLREHEYLLERRMLRSLSTGKAIDPDWTGIQHKAKADGAGRRL